MRHEQEREKREPGNGKCVCVCAYSNEVTPFSVAICMKQTKILCRQLNCSVKLVDVSTTCSSHPQGI